jgi:hypothetical protein
MPFDRSKYPANWSQISRAVKEAAGWRCEFCGARHGEPNPATGSKVVLTTMHLDHNPQNNDPANLKAGCQRCHLRYDAKHHVETRRRNRAKRQGQMELIP